MGDDCIGVRHFSVACVIPDVGSFVFCGRLGGFIKLVQGGAG